MKRRDFLSALAASPAATWIADEQPATAQQPQQPKRLSVTLL